MKIGKNSVVSFHYTLTDDSGSLIDSSESEPLIYLHGAGNIIAGLEEVLEGKGISEKLEVTIPPDKGYGRRNEELLQVVRKDQFEDPEELEPGLQFQAMGPEGPAIFTITKIEGADVTIDGNHPLADITLNFKVEIVDIRAATAEEITHGHVHGPGGHHHH